jgi:hypothetical protein
MKCLCDCEIAPLLKGDRLREWIEGKEGEGTGSQFARVKFETAEKFVCQ